MDADGLHRDSIVIDAVCPLLRDKKYLAWYAEGGVTVAAPTVASTEDAETALRSVGGWLRHLKDKPGYVQVQSAAEIEAAKRDGRMGLLFHFQGTGPFEDDPGLVQVWRQLGVGIVQLCYNVRNRVGDGADERTDSGLSYFGVEIIKAMNEARMIVDCAHTGIQTSFDAIDQSRLPVVVSHGNPRGVHESKRNLPDDLIRAVAAQGGVVGMVGFPAFVGDSARPTLDRFIDHFAYVADLVGVDHLVLGIDYYNAQWPVMSNEEAERYYAAVLASGKWRPGTYPPPPHYYPEGIETPRTLPALTRRLLERGFTAEDVRKILGLNWMRVYRAVWGA